MKNDIPLTPPTAWAELYFLMLTKYNQWSQKTRNKVKLYAVESNTEVLTKDKILLHFDLNYICWGNLFPSQSTNSENNCLREFNNVLIGLVTYGKPAHLIGLHSRFSDHSVGLGRYTAHFHTWTGSQYTLKH